MSDRESKLPDTAIVAAMLKARYLGVKMLASDCEAILGAALEHCKQGDPVAFVTEDVAEYFGKSNMKFQASYVKGGHRTVPLFAHAMPKSEGKPEDVLSEWLATEISAIPTRYNGSPSYDHDAYYFKTEVLSFIDKHKSVIDAAPQPTTDISELVKELDSYLKGTLATPCNVSRRIKLRKLLDEVIAKHTVKA